MIRKLVWALFAALTSVGLAWNVFLLVHPDESEPTQLNRAVTAACGEADTVAIAMETSEQIERSTRLLEEAQQLGADMFDAYGQRAKNLPATIASKQEALMRRDRDQPDQLFLAADRRAVEKLRAIAPEVLRADDTKPGGVVVDVALAKRMGEDRLTVAQAMLKKMEGCGDALKARAEYFTKERNAAIQREASGRAK
jgi:hypothetical protein